MITLIGRRVTKTVEPLRNKSLLDLALKHDVDWGFSCSRGTCGRCRCIVETGSEYLMSITGAEADLLEPEDLEQGVRLACQAKPTGEGPIHVRFKPLF